ncbi:hypothetical protein GCM10027446_08560 [Angustibacter peucedani]
MNSDTPRVYRSTRSSRGTWLVTSIAASHHTGPSTPAPAVCSRRPGSGNGANRADQLRK